MKTITTTFLVGLVLSSLITEAYADPNRRGGSSRSGGSSVGPRSGGRTAGPSSGPSSSRVSPSRSSTPNSGQSRVSPGPRRSGPATSPVTTPSRPSRPSRPVVTSPRNSAPGHRTSPGSVRPTSPNRAPVNRGAVVSRPGTTVRRPVVISRPAPGVRRVSPSVRAPIRSHVVHRRYAPVRSYFGTARYFNAYGYRPVNYVRYHHNPWLSPYSHSIRYVRPFHYYNFLRVGFSNYLYLNWIYYPSSFSNGYHVLDNYPFYVFNGYRHRYSSFDQCNYQLVDKYTHQVMQSYWGLSCKVGYDSCAVARDRLNFNYSDFRYSCVETFRDQSYNFSRPTYEYNTYENEDEADDYDSQNCWDYDAQYGQCYDQYDN